VFLSSPIPPTSPCRRHHRVDGRLEVTDLEGHVAQAEAVGPRRGRPRQVIGRGEARERILDVMEIQLRDYRIRQGHIDDWIAGWERGVVPLRQQEGFVLIGAWVDRPHHRFVWVLGYPGPDGFEAAEARYHASSARLALRPNPSDFVDTASLDMVDGVSC
jgi:hypothetical protein